MIVPSKNQKTYGVLHTENYFSFLGFCKKVNSNKIQKIDVLIDNVLIDTIIADKHIQKIEDIYELEGFGFEYILPNKYIGQKSVISFKNHETNENLQNSPYDLLDELNPKFNKHKFIHSLLDPINEEKIKDLYCPNSIGFLATEENLTNNQFVSYIKKMLSIFPTLKFKAFYLESNQKLLIDEIFSENLNISITSISTSNIEDIIKNVEYYLSSEFCELDINLLKKLKSLTLNILPLNMNLSLSSVTLEEWEIKNSNIFNLFFEHITYFGFSEKDIEKYGHSYHSIFYKKMMEKYCINSDFNLNMSVSEAYVYLHIQLCSKEHSYIHYLNEFIKKFDYILYQNSKN